MNILGINSSVGASVCLLKDGQIIFALQEERLSRIKNQGGIPKLCLEYIKVSFPEFTNNIDYIALSNIDDTEIKFEDIQKKYQIRFTPPKPRLRSYFKRFIPRPVLQSRTTINTPTRAQQIKNILNNDKLDDSNFQYIDHHDCHAAAAYFGLAKNENKPYLIFTLDGGGDGLCATISIGKNNKMTRISTSESGNSIGNIYSLITYYLGLRPHEHEYKLMGLSPYVPSHYGRPISNIFKRYIKLDSVNGLKFERTTVEKTSSLSHKLKKDLQYTRFDTIASGLQQATEEIVVQWIKNGIKHTGIKDILLSGGVFMNVKINQLIAELNEVNSVNVFPSCGDESNAIGAAFYTYADKSSSPKFPVFNSYTTGPKPLFDFEKATHEYAERCTFKRLAEPEKTIAQLLADGEVVARVGGKMEFGARSLGNRSLLADPKNPEVIDKINFMIKQRDFWMPFAPAVLKEDASKYLNIPNSLPSEISPYMMFAFNTSENYKDMLASIHRADKTARAQIVDSCRYPELHKIISDFRSLTGRSVILNTSFNLHGHPIVTGTCDSIEVLLKSDLKYLVVEDTLITKRETIYEPSA